MPTSFYGPSDNYDPVTIWGTGTPRREFLYVDDYADDCVYLLSHCSGTTPLNIGAGQDISILERARLVMMVSGYDGTIEHDLGKPDGIPRNLLDISRLAALGWAANVLLDYGITLAYADWLAGGRRHQPL